MTLEVSLAVTAKMLVRPGILGDSRVWKDESYGKRDHVGKADDTAVYERGEERAVRLVFQLREELGESQGTVVRIADQLGYGTESVRRWVAQAEIDAGGVGGISTAERAKMKKLEQENRELRRANEILKRASVFFAAELDRPQR